MCHSLFCVSIAYDSTQNLQVLSNYDQLVGVTSLHFCPELFWHINQM